jgi:amino acid transporter
MGEYAAVLAASCLTLEYGVSGAAVARSWGDKVLEWMDKSGIGEEVEVDHVGEKESFFNPLAGLISLASVVVLACGVQESKKVTNFFTITKMGIVAFMIVGGFCLFQADNMVPLVVPAQVVASANANDGPAFGAAGILRGATSSFFGYLGFDEVVCLAAEAKTPSDTPKAVLWTLAIVTVVYILASIALSGMLPYQEISDTSGFPNAFASRGIPWAANLAAFGEVFTLPVVVLISLLAQPRLCAAMAKDGLLPAIFALQTEKDGNLLWSNVLCGIPMTLLATFVPFSWMDDAISVGILFAFNMTNTSLIVMRCSGGANANSTSIHNNRISISDSLRDGVLPADQDVVVAVDEANGIVSSASYHKQPQRSGRWSLATHLCCYHLVALMAGLTSHLTVSSTLPGENDNAGDVSQIVSTPWWSAQIAAAGVALAYALWFHRSFPATGGFGDIHDVTFLERSHDSNADIIRSAPRDDDGFGNVIGNGNGIDHHHTSNDAAAAIFEVPLCPFLPLAGVYLNWYLISQLEWSGMVLLLVFLIIISMLYAFCISGSPAVSSLSQLQQQQRYSPIPKSSEATSSTTSPTTATTISSAPDGPILLREISLPKRTMT